VPAVPVSTRVSGDAFPPNVTSLTTSGTLAARDPASIDSEKLPVFAARRSVKLSTVAPARRTAFIRAAGSSPRPSWP